MGLLTFTLNVTLDGCYDHREMIADDELHDHFTQLLGAGGGILYGRTTYELMEAYWPGAARDEKAPRAARERWSYQFDGAGRLSQRTDPAGRLTRYLYDSEGRLTSRQAPDGDSVTLRYSTLGAAAGLPVAVIDALGRETAIGYDAFGNTVKTTAPGDAVTLVERDASGMALKVTEPSGLVHRTGYDVREGVVSQVLGAPEDGEAIAYRRVLADGWEGEGSHVPASAMLEATDGEGRAWLFERDPAFQLVRVTTPGEGKVEQGFDEKGRRLRRTTEDGSAERFEWSEQGRLVQRHFEGPAEGAQVRFGYDALGRVESLTDPLLIETRTFSPGLGWSRVTVTPSAELGEPARFTLVRNRPEPALTTQELGATRYLIHTAHDGQTARVELEKAEVANSARDVLTFTYDASRKLESLVRGNGAITRRFYDAAGRVERQEEQATAGALTLTFGYDAAGRLASRTSGSVTRLYSYGEKGRLASCSDSAESFTYDKVGARASAGARSYARDERGRLLSDGESGYAYDALGRRVERVSKSDPADRLELRYGPAGLLAEVRRGAAGHAVAVASYRHDGSGRRVQRTTAAGSWHYGCPTPTGRCACASPTGPSGTSSTPGRARPTRSRSPARAPRATCTWTRSTG